MTVITRKFKNLALDYQTLSDQLMIKAEYHLISKKQYQGMALLV